MRQVQCDDNVCFLDEPKRQLQVGSGASETDLMAGGSGGLSGGDNSTYLIPLKEGRSSGLKQRRREKAVQTGGGRKRRSARKSVSTAVNRKRGRKKGGFRNRSLRKIQIGSGKNKSRIYKR
ncbi:unnamed protein product, partial [Allacma fusca]